jgi:hypothetical protein
MFKNSDLKEFGLAKRELDVETWCLSGGNWKKKSVTIVSK